MYTPGAHIVYPEYHYHPATRREELSYQTAIPAGRLAAAAERRAKYLASGWRAPTKAPYRPLGTPRFDLTAQRPPRAESERLQIRHPLLATSGRDANGEASYVHKTLESGKAMNGRVAQFSYQVCGARAGARLRWRGANVPLPAFPPPPAHHPVLHYQCAGPPHRDVLPRGHHRRPRHVHLQQLPLPHGKGLHVEVRGDVARGSHRHPA